MHNPLPQPPHQGQDPSVPSFSQLVCWSQCSAQEETQSQWKLPGSTSGVVCSPLNLSPSSDAFPVAQAGNCPGHDSQCAAPTATLPCKAAEPAPSIRGVVSTLRAQVGVAGTQGGPHRKLLAGAAALPHSGLSLEFAAPVPPLPPPPSLPHAENKLLQQEGKQEQRVQLLRDRRTAEGRESRARAEAAWQVREAGEGRSIIAHGLEDQAR